MKFSQQIKIQNTKISENSRTFIIAEAGVNHNGDINLALKLIKAAKRAGADCVKFQTFCADNLVTEQAPKAKYQLKTTNPHESQKEMLRKLELPFNDYLKLIRYAEEEDIIFLSTPYNFEDVDFLKKLKVAAYKLASMHLVELPMVEYTAKKQKPVFLSTGMSTMNEIVKASQVFIETGNKNLILLQCTTNYPAKFSDANLRTMHQISKKTGAMVGYSDHTEGIEACVLAVAAGACVTEKHFTLDKNLPGPDQSSSASPDEFTEMAARIRQAEIILGFSNKTISSDEKRNIIGMRRSIATKFFIPRGTIITKKNVGFKRPAAGLSPNLLGKILGRKAKKDIPADTLLNRNDIL